MSQPKPNNGTLAEIEIYVRRHFRDLSLAEHVLYFDALRILELKNGGTWKSVGKPEDVWSRESGASRPTVRKGLGSLQRRGLIHLKRGNNGQDGRKRKFSIVRRYTIAEIIKQVDADILSRFIPADIEDLAAELTERGTPWNGDAIRPQWNVTLTGRLNHSGSPMTQPRTNTKAYRLKALRRCLEPDEILVEADWSAAEPTVLCHALERRGLLPPGVMPAEIYEALAPAAGSRDKAKQEWQRLCYSPWRTISVPPGWNLPKEHFLIPLVAAVEAYRQDLWERGKPRNGQQRFVYTLTGRKIVQDRKGRTDRGDVLSWQLQGTVADVFGKVVRKVLDDDAEGKCRFFLPCHDAVYVAIKQGSGYDPAAVMQRYADEAELPLKTKVDIHKPLKP